MFCKFRIKNGYGATRGRIGSVRFAATTAIAGGGTTVSGAIESIAAVIVVTVMVGGIRSLPSEQAL
jgi:hypothetical protein